MLWCPCQVRVISTSTDKKLIMQTFQAKPLSCIDTTCCLWRLSSRADFPSHAFQRGWSLASLRSPQKCLTRGAVCAAASAATPTTVTSICAALYRRQAFSSCSGMTPSTSSCFSRYVSNLCLIMAFYNYFSLIRFNNIFQSPNHHKFDCCSILSAICRHRWMYLKWLLLLS